MSRPTPTLPATPAPSVRDGAQRRADAPTRAKAIRNAQPASIGSPWANAPNGTSTVMICVKAFCPWRCVG
jgi:hypothetical protein